MLGVVAIIAFTYYKIKMRSKSSSLRIENYDREWALRQLPNLYSEGNPTSFTNRGLSDIPNTEGSRALVLRDSRPCY